MMRAMAQPEFECGNRRKVLQIMEPMSLLARVLVGAIAGWLASKAVKSDFWLIFDAVAGMTGALVSGFLFNVFGRSGDTGFNLLSIFVAFVGDFLHSLKLIKDCAPIVNIGFCRPLVKFRQLKSNKQQVDTIGCGVCFMIALDTV